MLRKDIGKIDLSIHLVWQGCPNGANFKIIYRRYCPVSAAHDDRNRIIAFRIIQYSVFTVYSCLYVAVRRRYNLIANTHTPGNKTLHNMLIQIVHSHAVHSIAAHFQFSQHYSIDSIIYYCRWKSKTHLIPTSIIVITYSIKVNPIHNADFNYTIVFSTKITNYRCSLVVTVLLAQNVLKYYVSSLFPY